MSENNKERFKSIDEILQGMLATVQAGLEAISLFQVPEQGEVDQASAESVVDEQPLATGATQSTSTVATATNDGPTSSDDAAMEIISQQETEEGAAMAQEDDQQVVNVETSVKKNHGKHQAAQKRKQNKRRRRR